MELHKIFTLLNYLTELESYDLLKSSDEYIFSKYS